MVTTRPMNHGTALSDSATSSSITNSAANSHFACRAKCHKKAINVLGGTGFSGTAVGDRSFSKNASIADGYVRIWDASIAAPRVLNSVLKRALRAARRAVPDQHQGRSAGILRRSVQNTAAGCVEHSVLAILVTVSDCARATPNDTAV